MSRIPSITVISSARRPRWIVPKLARGIPADEQRFTAFAAFLGRLLMPEQLADWLTRSLEAEVGNPVAVGGLRPDRDLLECGIGQAQSYLPLVAEGRIDVRPGAMRRPCRSCRTTRTTCWPRSLQPPRASGPIRRTTRS